MRGFFVQNQFREALRSPLFLVQFSATAVPLLAGGTCCCDSCDWKTNICGNSLDTNRTITIWRKEPIISTRTGTPLI